MKTPFVHIAREHHVAAVWLMGDFESVCIAESTISGAAVADAIKLLRAAITELRAIVKKKTHPLETP